MSDRKSIRRHVFCFNPIDNGGESLCLITDYFVNEDNEIYTNQKISLQSYSNEASINLAGASLTPSLLRQLANELDVALIQTNHETQSLT